MMTEMFPARSLCTWVDELLGHVVQAADLLLLRGVDHHGGGAQDAEEAAQLPVEVQPLRQEVGGQHRTANTVQDTVSTGQSVQDRHPFTNM